MEEISESEEKLTEICSSLKSQLSNQVIQHDRDMQETLERNRKVSDDVHKTIKEKMELQLRSQFFADKQELVLKYENDISKLR